MWRWNIIAFLLVTLQVQGQDGQLAIARIELMPDQPSPYNMRDWGQVATNYDRFTYDLNKIGEFLPLIHVFNEGVNYPQNKFFSQPTYVGSQSPLSGEAINILPGLVGATLMGIDKSFQDGNNYLLMAQDFFNKKNGQNLYLNGNSTKSGNDWWYDMMPNVFFYQLYDLYPDWGGESSLQFSAVADLMLEAVDSMGGSATPWSVPNMNYRAWKFATMEPRAEGVPEPEAAGAFAWLLFHAYKETGLEKYRIGSEWAMEFLNGLNGNPSYELQLPYGTYIAAKMNAEEGTDYDIEKMVNWSFDKGNLRGWGTIVDTWSGIDVSGLVGESESDSDYAFQLNGIQQAAALVPMTRYDKRFARSIAKWVLNLANANRLFYHAFLPSTLQDASEWSEENDPNRVVGYEAIREDFNGLSPYSTGDAVKGGWAETNLALYGTSSIGYLGSMISKTNIDKILKIDLLKTDFFKEDAYPTFLIYNSYEIDQTVEFYTGTALYDIYNPVTESYMATSVTGTISLLIPSDQAIMPTVIPSGGVVSFEKNKLLVNGIVVDYDQHLEEYSSKLRIKAVAAKKSLFSLGQEIVIFSTIEYEGELSELDYQWRLNGILLDEDGAQISVNADEVGDFKIEFIVKDSEESDTSTFDFIVIAEINEAPVIQSLVIESSFASPNEQVKVVCIASDPNQDELFYEWSVSGGQVSTDIAEAIWDLPNAEGIYKITVKVTDPSGLVDEAVERILVKVFEEKVGNLIAYYPLDMNGNDLSGNELDGTLVGGVSASNAEGINNTAYFFNGTTHYMEVDNDALLNFTEAVTLSFWMKPDNLPDRESFLVSHGSWQNRWKASIIPDRRLRWTVNTANSIVDLDSRNSIVKDSFIHVSLSYDGAQVLMYINGLLDNFAPLSGLIRMTSLPLFLAQSLPEEQAYNYRGVLDEVRLYDFALTPDQVSSLYQNGNISSLVDDLTSKYLLKVYPNPSADYLMVDLHSQDNIDLIKIYDASGRHLMTCSNLDLHNKIPIQQLMSGMYHIQFLKDNKIQHTGKFIKN